MKKKLSLLILLCLLAALFCSCGKSGSTSSSVDANGPNSLFSVVNNGKTDFIIVRPDGDTEVNALAVKLVKAYKAQWNVSMTNSSDAVERKSGVPEIIISQTARPESAEALQMLLDKGGRGSSYIICVINGNIVINSLDPMHLSKAVDTFIETFVEAPEISTTLCECYFDDSNYRTLTVNGTPHTGQLDISLCGYKDSFLVKTEIEALITSLAENYGYPVKVVDSDNGDIIIGASSGADRETAEGRENYSITVTDGKICIDGGSDYALAVAVREFANAMAEGSLKLDNGTQKSGSYTETVGNYNAATNRKLVWNHEFEVNSTDELSTHFVNTHDHMSSRDDNLVTSMSEQNFFVTDNNMVLRITSDGNQNYTTARSVSTATKMAFRYGYVEMRAIAPYKKCVWPSFWMKPAGNLVQSKYRGEIDIFEIFSSTDTAVPNLHKWYEGNSAQIGNNGNVLFGQRKYTFKDTTDLNSTYHIYGFEWTPEYMAFFVDGELYYKVGITEADEYTADRPGMDCFHAYYYLCFNNWVYTDQQEWTDPSLRVENNPDFGTVDYVIDYVRLYQSSEEGLAIDYTN